VTCFDKVPQQTPRSADDRSSSASTDNYSVWVLIERRLQAGLDYVEWGGDDCTAHATEPITLNETQPGMNENLGVCLPPSYKMFP
jgi:hypothetical protein